jgi:ribosomal protein S27AE
VTSSLRRMVDQRDRENARRHRLDPERLVLAPRPGGGARQVCGKACGYAISVWEWHFLKHPERLRCPRCGADLVLVEG